MISTACTIFQLMTSSMLYHIMCIHIGVWTISWTHLPIIGLMAHFVLSMVSLSVVKNKNNVKAKVTVYALSITYIIHIHVPNQSVHL